MYTREVNTRDNGMTETCQTNPTKCDNYNPALVQAKEVIIFGDIVFII